MFDEAFEGREEHPSDAEIVLWTARHLLVVSVNRGDDEDEWRELVDALVECFPLDKDSNVVGQVSVSAAKNLERNGRRETAHEVLEAAAESMPRDHFLRPYVAHQLASLDEYRQRWSEAETVLLQAIEDLGSPPTSLAAFAMIRSLLGKTYLGMGLTDRAAPLILESLETLESLYAKDEPVRRQLLDAYRYRANLRLARRDHSQLLEELSEALENRERLLNQFPGNREKLWVLAGLACFKENLSLRDWDARRFFQEALASSHTWPADRLTAELRLAYLELSAGDPDAAKGLIDSARRRVTPGGTSNPIDRAYLAALDCRWAIASGIDRAEQAVRYEVLQESIQAMREKFAGQPPRPGGWGYLEYRRYRFPLGELLWTHLLMRDDGPERSLQELLDFQCLNTLVRRMGGASPTVAEVQRALTTEKQGLLVYYPNRPWGLVFAVDSNSVACATFPWSLQDFEQVNQLSEELRLRPFQMTEVGRQRRERRIKELLGELSTRLFPGTVARSEVSGSDQFQPPNCADESIAAALERWDAVTLVGTDLLRNLPFECLPFQEQPLGVQKAVALLPSLPLGQLLAQRHASKGSEASPNDLCLVTNSTHGAQAREAAPHLEPLRIESPRLQRLMDSYRDSSVVLLEGAKANRERLQDVLSSPFRVVHFLTHGVQRDAERSAGIVLSSTVEDSGLLFREHAEQLPAGDLVLLSACQAGGGPLRVGDSATTNLAGGFLLAGAQATVAADTDLVLEATLPLMERFHHELASGASPAEALRIARGVLVDSKEFADPYYWTFHQAVGLAHLPLFEAATVLEDEGLGWWWWGGVGAAVAIAVTMLVARRKPATA